MNYILKDVQQLITDAKTASKLLDTKIFDEVNWLDLHCQKGGEYGVFSSLEWIHFNNIERHLSNILYKDAKIFNNISDIVSSKSIPSDLLAQVKQSALEVYLQLKVSMSRMLMVSQTAYDIDRHNKKFYNPNSAFIKEKVDEDYIPYSKTNVLYPKQRKNTQMQTILKDIQKTR